MFYNIKTKNQGKEGGERKGNVHLIIYIRAREKEKYELKKGDFLLCGGNYFFQTRKKIWQKKGETINLLKNHSASNGKIKKRQKK